MPSLVDALDSITSHSQQISQLAAHNTSPAGPFVQAFLYQPTVNGLIRDAYESETRLFKFVGQVDGAAGGVVKKVEKRDGELTPLKEYKRRKENREAGGNGRDEVEAMLRVAMKLVDDYRPMPRARAHIAKLLAEHQRQLERIDELEQLIAEASGPSKPSAAPARDLSASTADQSTAPLGAEDAIKAEEASLRALDASLAELRRARPPSPAGDASPEKTPPASPPRRPRPSVGAALQATPRAIAQTPASKTPRHNITNALVNGATPARSRPTIDRFSPLRYLGTPRAPVGRESGLRHVLAEDEGRRSIFGGKALHFSTSSSGAGSRPAREPLGEVMDDNGADASADADEAEEEEVEEDQEEVTMEGEDETVRFVPHQQEEESVEEESVEEQEEETFDESSSGIAGVDVELAEVQAATDKIWATLPDLMAYLSSKDQTAASQDPASIVTQLHAIATSDVPPPPSPSSASTLSALASLPSTGPRPAVITPQTILLAHLCVLLLRAFSDGGNGTLDLAQAKEMLNATAKARGWDGENDIGTKTVYAGVGKRVFKLDRRGGGSGRIGFAL